MKECNKCSMAQPFDCFSKDSHKKDGLSSVCKSCRKKYLEAYYSVSGRREVKNQKAKERHHANREVLNAKSSARYYENIDAARVKRKAKYWSNPEEAKLASRQYMYKRIEDDPIYKLKVRYRKRVWEAYRSTGYTKRSKTFELLGCTHDKFKSHLEHQFTDGMTWENYGEWHVDHIIPFATAKSAEDVAKLCHYTNLQPLWAADNIKKGARLDYSSDRAISKTG